MQFFCEQPQTRKLYAQCYRKTKMLCKSTYNLHRFEKKCPIQRSDVLSPGMRKKSIIKNIFTQYFLIDSKHFRMLQYIVLLMFYSIHLMFPFAIQKYLHLFLINKRYEYIQYLLILSCDSSSSQ